MTRGFSTRVWVPRAMPPGGDVHRPVPRRQFDAVAGPVAGPGRGGGVLLRAAGGLDGRLHHRRPGHPGPNDEFFTRPGKRHPGPPGPGRSGRVAGGGRVGHRHADRDHLRATRSGADRGPGPAGGLSSRDAGAGRPQTSCPTPWSATCWAPGCTCCGGPRPHSRCARSRCFPMARTLYLARLNPARKSDGPPITVRVIEYTVHTTADGGTTTESPSPRSCSVRSPTCSTSSPIP